MKKFKVLMKIATVCLCCALVFSLAGCFKSVSMTPKFDDVVDNILSEMRDNDLVYNDDLEYNSYNSEIGSCIVKVTAWKQGDNRFSTDTTSSDGFRLSMEWDGTTESGYNTTYSFRLSFSRKDNGKSSMSLWFEDENYGLSSTMESLKEDELVFVGTSWKEGNVNNLTTKGDAGPAKEYVSERLVSVKATFNSILQEIMDDADITIDDLYLYE